MKLLLCFPLCLLVLQSVLGGDCPGETYTVKSGDTCWKTWKRNKMTEEEFRQLNPTIDCDLLDVGDELCIGSSGPKFFDSQRRFIRDTNQISDCAYETYIVKSEDTCWKTWRRNKMTEEEFRQLNPTIDCDLLDVGDELCVHGNQKYRQSLDGFRRPSFFYGGFDNE